MSDSCRNDLLIHNDECNTITLSSNQVQVSNTYKLLNIKRTFDVNKSTGTFIFHKGATSSRIHFVNDYHGKYVSAATLKRLKNICKKTDTMVTRISSNFLLNRNIRNKEKHFGKIKSKNLRSLKKTESCSFETRMTNKRLPTNHQLPKIQDSVNVSEDTDSDSVICLNIWDVASSNITTSKSPKRHNQNSSLVLDNSNNLNDGDIIVVKQYCNMCGEDLNMEYNRISDKHKCPYFARNHQKETKLINGICSMQKKDTRNDNLQLEKIYNCVQDNITTTTAAGQSSTTSVPLNIQSYNYSNAQSSTTVVTQDTGCNTSNTNLFFNDKNVINTLKRKVLEFLDKKYTQESDATSINHGNSNKYLYQNFANPSLGTITEKETRQNNYQLVSQTNNDYRMSGSIEHNHNIYVSTEIIRYGDDKEQDCIDNTRDNYIFGYNYYGSTIRKKSGLRLIVVDGSNVALGHSKGKFFSSEGLKICIEYFYQRGHEVKAFVPQFRLKNGQTSNKQLLQWLYNRGWIIFTPSREVNGRMIVPYDDRFIVQCAALHDAVIVSNDCYRDLIKENPEWRKTIENNLLMVTWVDDVIYFPIDPLGKRGPTLERFLRYS